MERLRKEEEERRRRISEELERRKKLQSDYEGRIISAIDTLDSVISTCQKHRELRSQLDPATAIGNATSPLERARTTFEEQTKKSLKSDFKKCTAFVKKLKSGSFPTPSEVTSPNSAIRTLNLSRYVEEVAAAIVEPGGGGSKVKLTDVPGIVTLCVEMHRRYDGFVEGMIPVLLAGVGGAGGGGANPSSANDGDDGNGSSIPRRICLRLLTEFIIHGIVTDTKPILKVIAEAAGAPPSSSSSGKEERSGSKEYAVTDANLIVTFAKTGGLEILGVLPRSVRLECERLEKEVSGKGDGLLVVVPPEDNESSALGKGDEQNKGEAKRAEVEEARAAVDDKHSQLTQSATQPQPQPLKEEFDLEQPFTPTLPAPLLARAQATLHSLQSTVTSSSSLSALLAIPPPLSNLTKQHCLGAYRTLSNTYLTTHRRLIQLEKRCEQDRLLQGNLSDAREKGLKDAKSLMDSLTKSVEALSEALDLDIPPLPSSEEELGNGNGDGAADGKGIELWTKTDNGPNDPEAHARLGPFDDEETRSFYCDVPDLLATNPPAMLGIAAEDVEKKKERNERQYGGVGVAAVVAEGDSGGGSVVDESEVVPMEVEEMSGDEGGDGDVGEDGEEGVKEGKENKDTPHYKLMVLLEQELPEASRREKIDELAERFCVNHGSNKNSRKRLYKTLFLVPFARLDLLPYYSRFAAILDRVYSDSTLVTELEQQMHGQARFKKNQNLESRLRTARYLGELTKFRVAPPIVVLRGLRRCLEDFSGHNIDVACCLLESCGRYLYRTKHTHGKLSELMDTMMRLKKAKNLDERHVAMITSAFFMVNPPRQTNRPTKEVSPLEAYLRYLLTTKLEPDEISISFVSKQIQRLPWSDPGIDCGSLVCKFMLKACRKGRYKATKAIALVAANLKRSKPEVPARLIDAVLEEIQWFIENPNFRDHQRTIVCSRILGELYCAGVIPSSIIFEVLHHILNFGHDIPDALRQASKNQETLTSHGRISQAIPEDGELEEDENKNNEEEKPKVVSVSRFSKYDTRVPCEIDPPTAVFRIKLVCTILETVTPYIVSATNKVKLDFVLAALQRYLFTKISLPSDVEFSVLDIFDGLDSQLRKLAPKESRRGPNSKSSGQKASAASFERYTTWLDAHNFVIAAEEAETLSGARASTRLLAQAGLLVAEDSSNQEIEGELLEEDLENSVGMSEDDETLDSVKDSMEGDSDDESNDDSSAASEAEGESVDGDSDESDSDSESEGESEEDEESFAEEDEIDQASSEAAYLRQLQDEAFESELRKLTMEALEKGKVSARTGTGGKVSSSMPSAPQFIAKKSSPVEQSQISNQDVSVPTSFNGDEGMKFKLLKRGHKGKAEEKQIFVPASTNLAKRATKQDDEAAKERDIVKARVLQYEAESAELQHSGGNVYLDQTKLQVIRNRPLSMEVIDRNFGKKPEAPYKISERLRRPGRGGGRLFNPGRGTSGRSLK